MLLHGCHHSILLDQKKMEEKNPNTPKSPKKPSTPRSQKNPKPKNATKIPIQVYTIKTILYKL